MSTSQTRFPGFAQGSGQLRLASAQRYARGAASVMYCFCRRVAILGYADAANRQLSMRAAYHRILIDFRADAGLL
jgi:hypothetical protein